MRKFLEKNWIKLVIIVVGIIFAFGLIDNNSTDYDSKGYHESSKSGIYYSEECPITTCNDGACSSSTGRGTCSHHGGVSH